MLGNICRRLRRAPADMAAVAAAALARLVAAFLLLAAQVSAAPVPTAPQAAAPRPLGPEATRRNDPSWPVLGVQPRGSAVPSLSAGGAGARP